MSSNLPVPESSNWFAEWVSAGKIPGAVKAIAHLVGSTGNAASAWVDIVKIKGEQIQQRIKDDADARSVLMKALAKAAAANAVQDPDRIDRVIDRLAGKAFREFENIDEVAKKAAEYVDQYSDIDPESHGPTADWLDFVSSHAEKANSEQLRDMWARVVAGEIRKPGSYSFQALQFISILDKELAEAVQNVLPYIADELYLLDSSIFSFTPMYSELQFLKQSGFFSDEVKQVFLANSSNIFIRMHEYFIKLVVNNGPDCRRDVLPLSRVGREISKLISASTNVEIVRQQANSFKNVILVEQIILQEIIGNGAGTGEFLVNDIERLK